MAVMKIYTGMVAFSPQLHEMYLASCKIIVTVGSVAVSGMLKEEIEKLHVLLVGIWHPAQLETHRTGLMRHL